MISLKLSSAKKMQFKPFLSEFDGFNRSLEMELKRPENVVISEDHIIFSLRMLFFEMIFPIWNANRQCEQTFY